MARPTKSVDDTNRNMTKQERAARKVVQEMLNQANSMPPEPIEELDKSETEIFDYLKNLNPFYSVRNSISLTHLAQNLVMRKKLYKEFKVMEFDDTDFDTQQKRIDKLDKSIESHMKKLSMSIEQQNKLAYDIAKMVQENISDEVENEDEIPKETDAVLRLISKI
ncbi:hypothetical protein [Priestia megaterium]|uniref:hypothetical protein n=1 Tax=Priestia megaterium TaxID=1404 RepID=UPI002E239B01|nr:hypothetical protein [Priestia megaterium]MED4278303.1 hypothetical protein [Priestia megaterium]MED4314408.1 hypothetical protein [Priestia megaterium]